jgi:biopolymer transport protein ExbD
MAIQKKPSKPVVKQPEPAPVEEVVVETTVSTEEPHQDAVVETTPVAEEPVEVKIPEVKKTAQPKETLMSKTLKDNIQLYYENMKPNKPVSPEEGAKHQYKLYMDIMNIFNTNSVDEFKKNYRALIQIVKEHRNDIFHEAYIARFMKNWPGSDRDGHAFINMCHLLLETADASNIKSVMSSIDTDKFFEPFDTKHKDLLMSFYA